MKPAASNPEPASPQSATPRPPRRNSRPPGSRRPEATTDFGTFMPGSRFISRVLFTVAVGILIWIGFKTVPALVLFFAAVVLGVVFHGCSRLLGRFIPGGRKVTLPLVVLAFIGAFTLAIVQFAPNAAAQTEAVLGAISDAYDRFAATPVGQGLLRSGESESGEPDLMPFPLDAAMIGKAAGLASNAARALASIGLVFVVAIFLAASPYSIRKGIVSLFPPALRARMGEVVDTTAHALWRWTIGQGFSMLVIGALAVAIYSAIGLRFALTLGLIAGLFQFIPYLGPTLSAIPALLVAFSMSPNMVLWTGIGYAVIQAAEGNFITPLIMKREAYLPPTLAIMATVVFGLLLGLAGAALATPLVVVLLTLYREVYQKDILHADLGDDRSRAGNAKR